MINRRDFLACGLAGGVVAAGQSLVAGTGRTRPACFGTQTAGFGRFRLNYAPHFGMFRNLAGDDLVDQVRFMADEGFRAVEDAGLRQRPAELQSRIADEIDRRGMSLGAFTATADFGNPTFTSGRKDRQAAVLSEIEESLEVALRMNARWLAVVPGKVDRRLLPSRQTANAVELLKRCAALCERQGRVMVLEPLSQGEMFLRTAVQAWQICHAVDSPACKMLFDVSRADDSCAGLISRIERCWDEVACLQVGDNPGRKEPGTGVIDFRRIFEHLASKGFQGIVGMEHGNSQPGEEGEQRVIEAYLAHDRF